MDLKAYLDEKRDIIEKALLDLMPEPEGYSAELIKAMHYSLFAGGKRLRPILCMAGAEIVGGEQQQVLQVACALELIHTYSLIHDDLPAMDNDDYRRGKLTNHKVHGEAMAILAGDALLTEAFNLMAQYTFSNNVIPDLHLRIIKKISHAIGWDGMVGGQAVDILTEGKGGDSSLVEFIHTYKTGALICASVTSGAILGGGSEEDIIAIDSYGKGIGLAFQIADDILDIEGESLEMGKTAGSDVARGKNTYPSIYGLDTSKEILGLTIDKAIESLKGFDEKADPLRHIAKYIIERKK